VTQQARIYAWQPYGQLVLVRDGTGPYTCVASGSASLRFAKPPLPYPDPFCADAQAWAFIQAYWTEEDPEPTEAIRPLPRAPGLVWMLMGLPEATGHVAASEETQVLVQARLMGAAPGAGHAAVDAVTMTPQLMILPLPINPAATGLPGTYDPTHPLISWMLVRGTPIGHMPVPVPAAIHQALMASPPDPAPYPLSPESPPTGNWVAPGVHSSRCCGTIGVPCLWSRSVLSCRPGLYETCLRRPPRTASGKQGPDGQVYTTFQDKVPGVRLGGTHIQAEILPQEG
jgi:hypothetical protein